MKLVYRYMTIFFTFSPTSNHLYPLQVENCDSNLRLVVDEDNNGKFRLERLRLEFLTQFPASNDEKNCLFVRNSLFLINTCLYMFISNRHVADWLSVK